MKSVPFVPVKPEYQKFPAIEVPQGMYGLSKRTQASRHVRYMTTGVQTCLALGLVGYGEDSEYPFVTLGHLDNKFTGALSVRYLLRGFSMAARLQDTAAYVVQGDSNDELSKPVLEELEKADLEDLFVHIGCRLETLTIDLVTGDPHRKGKEFFPTYVPNREAQKSFELYFRSDRMRSPIMGDTGYPMACAFHLAGGIPDYYELKMPLNVPAETARLQR